MRAATTLRRSPLRQADRPNKYAPHQGIREMARRRRQMVRAKLKAETK